MAFLEEIAEIFDIPMDSVFGAFSVLFSANSAAVENVVKIVGISGERIEFLVKGGRVTISGEGLELVASGKGAAFVKGKIDGVALS